MVKFVWININVSWKRFVKINIKNIKKMNTKNIPRPVKYV